ncbi:MAG: beta-lactamase family protein, partial [Actinobacteria bacterium]|nr:beta-lactamase family protein [Actinomycetota bacterium]
MLESVYRCARRSGFSGVVRVDAGDETLFAGASGLAHRGWQVPNRLDTRFQIASGAKGFTASAVASLIEDGQVGLDTTARSLLGEDLPLIDDDVTIEHLLAHRSGIGDYLDESGGMDVTAYIMPLPVHRLACAEDYLAVLDGYPQVFPPGERFAYCNGGYVVLAIIAERAAGQPYHDLVHERVCQPAGLVDTAFLRTDESHERLAEHYLTDSGLRTNVLHLPVVGVGDGGITSTAEDLHAFWRALFAGRIVASDLVARFTQVHTEEAAEAMSYGLGF